jgi:hypothetical protein
MEVHMNKVRFLTKITMVAGVFAALTFTISCSDDKDKGGGTGRWCVIVDDWGEGEETQCGEIGANLLVTGWKLTEEMCHNNYDNSSVEDEKPGGCKVITD